MLQDKDRIFTNLYGLHDPFLNGAKSRGDWDATKIGEVAQALVDRQFVGKAVLRVGR